MITGSLFSRQSSNSSRPSGNYEMLRPQLKKLDTWIVEWEVKEEDQRKLFEMVAEVADDSGEEEYVCRQF